MKTFCFFQITFTVTFLVVFGLLSMYLEGTMRAAKENIVFYYPTLLRREQIMRETTTKASRNFGETKTLDNKSLIRHFGV